MPFYYETELYYRCPLKLITPLSYEYIKAFTLYQKSMLPNNKGWLEESEKFLEAMTVIENAQVRINNEMIERGKK